MLTIFVTAVNAILPIVLLIALGYGLRQCSFLTKEFVAGGNKLMFRLLIPLMLFTNTYTIESFSSVPWDLTLYGAGMVLVIFLLGYFLTPGLTREPGRKGALLQSTFRSNTAVIGISLAQALGGEEAVQVATVVTAVCVPLLNVLAVVALSIYGSNGGKLDGKKLLKNIVTNPLILGIAAGFLCVALRAAEKAFFWVCGIHPRREPAISVFRPTAGGQHCHTLCAYHFGCAVQFRCHGRYEEGDSLGHSLAGGNRSGAGAGGGHCAESIRRPALCLRGLSGADRSVRNAYSGIQRGYGWADGLR